MMTDSNAFESKQKSNPSNDDTKAECSTTVKYCSGAGTKREAGDPVDFILVWSPAPLHNPNIYQWPLGRMGPRKHMGQEEYVVDSLS
jgi:hypothetical protein